MQPFCNVCTPIISELADQRKSVIAVSILTSSKVGLEASGEIKQKDAGKSLGQGNITAIFKSEDAEKYAMFLISKITIFYRTIHPIFFLIKQ